jgi:hypothetical protein
MNSRGTNVTLPMFVNQSKTRQKCRTGVVGDRKTRRNSKGSARSIVLDCWLASKTSKTEKKRVSLLDGDEKQRPQTVRQNFEYRVSIPVRFAGFLRGLLRLDESRVTATRKFLTLQSDDSLFESIMTFPSDPLGDT